MDDNTNTHYYDGKIGNIYNILKDDDNLELINNISFNTCLNEMLSSLDEFNDTEIDKGLCKNTLFLFENDKKNNYDDINKIHLDDILPRTWKFIKHYERDTKLLFFEQIADIYNGPCAQGKIIRLFQFYQIHMDNKDNIYNKCKKNNK